jgi:para-aminobenzoate synthetase/4-amino-4-deoxychorismate lyase
MAPSARFDDLTTGGRSWALEEPLAEMSTHDPGQVPALIAEAEAGARSGRWVAGFVCYEAAPGFDSGLRVRSVGPSLGGRVPLAWFAFFDRCVEVPFGSAGEAVEDPSWTLEWNQARHRAAIDTIKGLIAAGTTYQVNLTARAWGTVRDPWALYAKLADAQRGGVNAFIETGSHSVVCASPELFFGTDHGRIVMRPMKGTARRGDTAESDSLAAGTLSTSTKERAENVMIVDMVRNDLGRIARTGSVRVDSLFELEKYPTVWQLTSTVAADLAPRANLATIFRALFPAASVTGAPKWATMKAIAELEDSPRGVYCGAVGWIAPGARRARFCVAIRTATVVTATGEAQYGTGGAITWPSDPQAEWDELLAKAAVLGNSLRQGRPSSA